MDDPLIVGPTRKAGRGRPKASEPRSTVSTRLHSQHHDRLIQLAHRHETSVSAVVRRLIVTQLTKSRG